MVTRHCVEICSAVFSEKIEKIKDEIESNIQTMLVLNLNGRMSLKMFQMHIMSM